MSQEETATNRPEVVPLIEPNGRKLKLNLGALTHFFESNQRAAKMKVAPIAVAGAYRGGKSFFLNFLLRYLRHDGRAGHWLTADGEDEALLGFGWRAGSTRHTTGILVWSELFVVRDSRGEETAVLLVDTQGSFDNESTVQDCATIFALSTLLSSVLVYNLPGGNITENDIQNLRFFSEFGNLALEENASCGKPFQTLLFLIRDWQSPFEHSYGLEGGRDFIMEKFKITGAQPEEVRKVRQNILNVFERVECCLLPRPGDTVTDPEFCGKIKDIDVEFVETMEILVPHLLSSENLIVKKIAGRSIKLDELAPYVQQYHNVFQSGKLPKPEDLLTATIRATLLNAAENAVSHYEITMDKSCGSPLSDSALSLVHNKTREEAIEVFNNVPKMVDQDQTMHEHCLSEISDKIKELHDYFVRVNTHRVILKKKEHECKEARENNRVLGENLKKMKEESDKLERQMKEMEMKKEEARRRAEQLRREAQEAAREHRRQLEEMARRREAEAMRAQQEWEQLQYQRMEREREERIAQARADEAYRRERQRLDELERENQRLEQQRRNRPSRSGWCTLL